MINWIKNLFKSKPAKADLRPSVVPTPQKMAEVRQAAAQKRRMSISEKIELNSAYGRLGHPPSRPTDGFQPSIRPLHSPTKARTEADSTRVSDTASVTDTGNDIINAMLIQSMLSTHSVESMPIRTAPSPAPAPDVQVTVRDYTIDTPPPPAPAPSHHSSAPSYDYSPSYSSSPSYDSSPSYSDSSSSYSDSSSSYSSFD